eukprot:m.60150 g.60150  ORF g.60150 m.60150 type:complete len:643 (-) comp13060_c0_seq1:119-2047(-)
MATQPSIRPATVVFGRGVVPEAKKGVATGARHGVASARATSQPIAIGSGSSDLARLSATGPRVRLQRLNSRDDEGGDLLQPPDAVASTLQLGAQFVLSHLNPLDSSVSPPKQGMPSPFPSVQSSARGNKLSSLPAKSLSASTLELRGPLGGTRQPAGGQYPFEEGDEAMLAARALAALPLKASDSPPALSVESSVLANGGVGDGRASASSLKSTPTAAPAAKPRLSFALMIAGAILESSCHRLTVSQIYDWMKLRYPYFAAAGVGTGWKNSVRHNLSLNKYFMKLPREEGEAADGPEAGGAKGSLLWTIRPEFRDSLVAAIERHTNNTPVPPPPTATAGQGGGSHGDAKQVPRRASLVAQATSSSELHASKSRRSTKPLPPTSARRALELRELVTTDTLAGATTLLAMNRSPQAEQQPPASASFRLRQIVRKATALPAVKARQRLSQPQSSSATTTKPLAAILPRGAAGTRRASGGCQPRQRGHNLDWVVHGQGPLRAQSKGSESDVAHHADDTPSSPTLSQVPRKRTNSGTRVFTFSSAPTAKSSDAGVADAESQFAASFGPQRSPAQTTPETKGGLVDAAASPPHARRRLDSLREPIPRPGFGTMDDDGEDVDMATADVPMDTTDDLVAGAALLSLASAH